ncbi:MAG: phenylalanine--tRNA ligase subunit alpha [Candidatus Heimdallarchaeota archaeon]|nr:phenylalanine--tRNA ligase subunit alpha [Candidatus Heimdallarchaeota archaeon]MDH5645039.1 phenylalanine--tRNA ligase subunit alpha [Candidatus Heimdallarchaeota archaeon]
MSNTTLNSNYYNILKIIHKNGPILVSKLVTAMEIDRGTLEAGIGVLEEMQLLQKDIELVISYELTDRGFNALDGLVERKILDVLIKNSVPFKDLAELTHLTKSDLTVGIGILKKANLIQIDKGNVNIRDEESAKSFSIDLTNALAELHKKSGLIIENNLIEQLLERNLIIRQERSNVTVSSNLSDSELKKIIVKDTITTLTSKMLSDGSWKNSDFKPYSLKTKPRKIYSGKLHPYRQFLEHLKTKLIGIGFQEMKGPLVELEFWNFDVLYAPQDHPAREDSDILLIKNPTHGKLQKEEYISNVAQTHENGWTTGSRGHGYRWDPKKAARLLVRPQGTAISARTLSHAKPPFKYFANAKVFRPDQVDATHQIEFSQTEGIICGPDITFKDLLGVLKSFAVEVAGAKEVRFRPDYFPFTSPSVELSAKHPVLGYIEFGGAGIFRPEVVEPFGIEHPVLAWGIGVDRLFMTKYGINDIRELYSQNLDWLREGRVYSNINLE